MNTQRKKRFQQALIINVILLFIVAGIHLSTTTSFNNQLHTSKGLFSDKPVYMDLHYRGDPNSSWYKEDVNLRGITYDGVLYNNSPDSVKSWSLRLNITKACYLNQFWNGTVEIHQYVGSINETVQTLNLAEYDTSKIGLEYMMSSGELLIPLHKGDYLIYIPSTEYGEMTINPGNTTAIGMIFYYDTELDLTDYSVDYYYYRNYYNGIGFTILCLLGTIFIMFFIAYNIAMHIYRSTEREMQLRRSGISCMAELYNFMYIIDLVKDTLTPVNINDTGSHKKASDIGANDQLKELCNNDVEPEYNSLMTEFTELSTLQERLKNRNSVVFEYISKSYGWCQMRFIAMDRVKYRPLEKVLCTIQQINQEKQELDDVIGQVEKIQSESHAKSAFLANMSQEIISPINNVIALSSKIVKESEDARICHYANGIMDSESSLLSLINNILDFSKLEAGQLQLKPDKYSLKDLIWDIEGIIRPKAEAKNLVFDVDLSPSLPDTLLGDKMRLKQIILNLLSNAVKYTEVGSIRFAIFGKIINERLIHLLISIKDTGIGMTADEQMKLFINYSRVGEEKKQKAQGAGVGINLVCGLLELMNSKLKVASIYGEGSDFYFELDQQIIGSISVDESKNNP
ncbi:MAG: hypothetical protein K5931_09505 [Lachnospiraceae bacterium]|nr:hypothetical protein [Lachnospiraceae bacterium]